MISFVVNGSFKNSEAFLRRMLNVKILGVLNANGQIGVDALAQATPIETSLAKSSWGFRAYGSGGRYVIEWTNSDIENGFPVAIMLHYGHGTGTGGYVQGQDFINPAMRPVFDKIADEVWKAVTSA